MVTSNLFYAFNVRVHFILNFITKHFKLIKSFGFFSKKICPCEPREIINTYKNVSLSTQTIDLHGTHEVHMEKLKRLLGGEILTLFVYVFCLLSLLARSTNTIGFLPKLRDATHSIELSKGPKILKVHVTKSFMPQLNLLIHGHMV